MFSISEQGTSTSVLNELLSLISLNQLWKDRRKPQHSRSRLWNCSLTRLSAQLIVILIAHSFTVFIFTTAISISRYYEEVLLPNHRSHFGLSGASRVWVKLNLLVRIFHAHFFTPQRLNRLRCLITLWKNVPGPFMELLFSFSCT